MTPSLIFLIAAAGSPGALAEDSDSDKGETQEGEVDEDGIPVMVVTGSRREQAITEVVVKTEVVTREEIEATTASNVSQVLETVPGVQISQSFRGAGIRMLGLDSQYVLILLDGQRVLGSMDGVVDLSRFSTHRIERIEVVKGTSSVLYGSDAIAGVVNLIRRRPAHALDTDVALKYAPPLFLGDYSTKSGLAPAYLDANVTAGVKRDDWSTMASVGYLGWASTDYTPQSPQQDIPAADRFTADATAWGRLTPALRLTADAGYMRRDSRRVYDSAEEEDFLDPPESFTYATFDVQNLTEDVEGRLMAEVVPDEVSALRITTSGGYFRDQYASDQRGSTALDDYQDTRDSQGQLVAQYERLMGRHFLTLGMEGQLEHLERDRLTQVGQRYRVAAYVQDEWKLGPAQQLTISPGARLDLDTFFGLYPTPRLALRYDPSERWRFRAVVGRGFKAPTFQQMYLEFSNPTAGYIVYGNEDLEPETSFNLYGGVEWEPSDRLLLSLDAFRIDLSNQIAYAAVPDKVGEWTFGNVSSSSSQGLEAGTQLQLGEAVSLLASYAFTYAYNDELQDLMEMNTLHLATLVADLDHEGTGLTANLRGTLQGPTRYYVTAEDPEDPDGIEPYDEPAYPNFSLVVGKRFLERRLHVYASVDNLFGVGNSDFLRVVPRVYWLGMTTRFASAD